MASIAHRMSCDDGECEAGILDAADGCRCLDSANTQRRCIIWLVQQPHCDFGGCVHRCHVHDDSERAVDEAGVCAATVDGEKHELSDVH
eukprot:7380726-Prymnesium_polylepis.3